MADGAEDLDLASRVLCPDGSCTGVIGDDGRCRECGRSADVRADEPASDAATDEVPAVEAAPEESAAADGDDRELCPDGNCVGLIGPDRRCKVCGLPAAV